MCSLTWPVFMKCLLWSESVRDTRYSGGQDKRGVVLRKMLLKPFCMVCELPITGSAGGSPGRSGVNPQRRGEQKPGGL